ncbi:MAG: polyphosphate kinase 1, partial [Proteobacteria bacterium]|nr:polyphosphate kinase 1 [Pseudomonadota bacterium]
MSSDFIAKEISWLSFNGRLLQEAMDPTVPLIERLKFLGIYSSNMDEFFEVRVATLSRLSQLGKKSLSLIPVDPRKTLKEVHQLVLSQQTQFKEIYSHLV